MKKILYSLEKHRGKNPFSLLLVVVLVLMFTSCDQQMASREYEEIVTNKPHQPHSGMHGEPQTSTGDLPPGHPDISSMNNLPPDHPDISSSMQMSAGQDDPELQKALDASVARPPLSWETPEGWAEEKGGSMRLATFRSKGKTGSIECSIVSLGGQAGGLQSNVVRWIKQINVSVPAPDQLKDFLSRQAVIKTKGEFSITVIDLTELTEEAQAFSMIAGIADLPDMTIFVKMTGSKEAILENREKFVSLSQSLKLNK